MDRGLYRVANAPVTELNSIANAAKRAPNALAHSLDRIAVSDRFRPARAQYQWWAFQNPWAAPHEP